MTNPNDDSSLTPPAAEFIKVDGADSTPPADEVADPEAEAHRKRMEELGLLDEEEETPEQIKAERDKLRKDLIEIAGRMSILKTDMAKLTAQLDSQKKEAAQILARVQRQQEEQKEFALEKFVKEELPVIDNLERALAAIPKDMRASDPKFDKLAQGVEKTLSQLTIVFNKFGLKEINPAGQEFDPCKHEAISTDDEADVEPDTVVSVAQKGYELNGRIVRMAKVIVKL